MLNLMRKKEAPEIEFDSDKQWINSRPLKLERLKGKIILLDFWAYSCVNCIRTLSALKKIVEKYKNKRFVLIGIHTPEFEFEKEIGNVKYAVKKHGINWPVLNDPRRINWDNYGNTYWPRAALINAEGELIFEHVGESGYDEIDSKIEEELRKLGEISDSKKIDEQKRKYAYNISKESYAGSLRNNGIGSGKVCTKEGCDEYADPKIYKEGVIYLQGDWAQTEEYLEYKGKEGRGYIAYRYYASEVNVVMSGVGEAEVLVDDAPLTKEGAGSNVVLKNRKSYVKLEGADMYNLIKDKDYHSRVLKILAFEEMKVFAYTFG